jgi:hypothetical protein
MVPFPQAISVVSLPLVGTHFVHCLKMLVVPDKANKTHPDVVRAQVRCR